MRLSAYLALRQLNDPAFAKLIGADRQDVHRYRTGQAIPRRAVMQDIFRVTEGAVTPNDFYDLPAGHGAPSTASGATSVPPTNQESESQAADT